MFKRKKYIRLNEVQGTPRTPELKRLLAESDKSRGCTVELPWRSQKTGLRYSITVCFEVGGSEPIWSLYQGEGAQSRMVWTQTFRDPELLNDVISLSLPAEAPTEIFQTGSPSRNDRDRDWNPNLDRSQHTYQTGAYDIELLSLPPDTTLPPKPESGAFFSLPPIDPAAESDAQPAAPRTENGHENAVEPAPQAPEQPPVAAVPTPANLEQNQQAQQAQQPPQPYPQQPAYPYPGYPPAYPPPPYGYQYPPVDPNAYPQGYPQGYPPPGYAAQAGYPPLDPNGYPQGYPQGYPPPDPAVYPGHYPPGYQAAYVPGYPLPPGMQYAQPVYQGQYAVAPQGTVGVPRLGADSDLIAKRPNVLLGDFLVETGLIPMTTLEAALQLQGMVRNGSLTTAQAAEAVRRAHNRGGEVEQFSPSEPQPDSGPKINAPPLGEILVEAGLIRISILKAALNLQEVVRTGALSKEEAVEAFIKEHFGKAGKQGTGESAHDQNVLELFIKAKLIQPKDLETAIAVRKKHGGEVAKILESAGKFDKLTFDAAGRIQTLLEEKRLKVEQAIIALHYCQRSRVSFDDAIEELGWEKP